MTGSQKRPSFPAPNRPIRARGDRPFQVCRAPRPCVCAGGSCGGSPGQSAHASPWARGMVRSCWCPQLWMMQGGIWEEMEEEEADTVSCGGCSSLRYRRRGWRDRTKSNQLQISDNSYRNLTITALETTVI